MSRKHIILICPEPIRRYIQGIGIRFLEMANTLLTEHHVVLWSCNDDLPEDLGVSVVPFPSGDTFKTEIKMADAVVVHGHISERYFNALRMYSVDTPPLVVDLYDPFLIENLQYTVELGDRIFFRDRIVLFNQLARGDFFLASSEIQRMFYIGILTGTGRITPSDYHKDNELNNLIAVAPYGIESISKEMLQAMDGKLKNQVPGIVSDDIVLFFGGVYDWYDPETLMNILGAAIQNFPKLRVIFSVNPNQETTPQGVFKKVIDFSHANGWIDTHVFFIPWFAYRDRFAYFRDVDIAVCLHKPSLETSLSLRTRILDYMNAGIPIIATEGGEGSRILGEADAALLVPPYDQESLQKALFSLLTDQTMRQTKGENGRRWVQASMTWPQSLQPLLEFCRNPYQSADTARGDLIISRWSALKRWWFFSVLQRLVRRLGYKRGRGVRA